MWSKFIAPARESRVHVKGNLGLDLTGLGCLTAKVSSIALKSVIFCGPSKLCEISKSPIWQSRFNALVLGSWIGQMYFIFNGALMFLCNMESTLVFGLLQSDVQFNVSSRPCMSLRVCLNLLGSLIILGAASSICLSFTFSCFSEKTKVRCTEHRLSFDLQPALRLKMLSYEVHHQTMPSQW